MPDLTPAPKWIVQRPIAHRALHDLANGRAENSWGAFQAAKNAGFAIECDLQTTADAIPVVFHDPDLTRLTKETGNVRDRTTADLSNIKLLDTDDCIYTLEKHLKQIDGTVPLVLELKGVEGHDQGFVEGVADALKLYSGQVCVMSFDHWICKQFATLMPDIPRGLTAEGGDDTYDTHMKAMNDFDLQFVSYSVAQCETNFVREIKDQGLPVITWTVRDEDAQRKTYQFADQITFEGFDPTPLSDMNHR